ncbi:MAG: DSD1 family PLP-dependent enzyme [Thermoproteota archaeon]
MNELDTPALVVDLDLLEGNIRKMADFFAEREAKLRPHVKTHKCPEIALMQLRAGAKGITCAKLGEAEAMAARGVDDILVANQIVGRKKIERLLELLGKCNLAIAVDDPSNAQTISDMALSAGKSVDVLIEVDVGMGRCGAKPGKEALQLAKKIAQMKGINLRGLMGYEGHAVYIENYGERRSECLKALNALLGTKSLLEEDGFEVGVVSGGGTGTYDITGSYPGVTEVQAGSYATMDARYKKVVQEFDCALRVLTTVISCPAPGRAVVDAGMKSITTEFGLPVVKGVEGATVSRLSEEHGILKLEEGAKLCLEDKIELIPSHGCTTVNLHEKIFAVRGGVVESVWDVAARGKSA